jgi:hypothetical protein
MKKIKNIKNVLNLLIFMLLFFIPSLYQSLNLIISKTRNKILSTKKNFSKNLNSNNYKLSSNSTNINNDSNNKDKNRINYNEKDNENEKDNYIIKDKNSIKSNKTINFKLNNLYNSNNSISNTNIGKNKVFLNKNKNINKYPVKNPCLLKGFFEKNLKIIGSGNFQKCYEHLHKTQGKNLKNIMSDEELKNKTSILLDSDFKEIADIIKLENIYLNDLTEKGNEICNLPYKDAIITYPLIKDVYKICFKFSNMILILRNLFPNKNMLIIFSTNLNHKSISSEVENNFLMSNYLTFNIEKIPKWIIINYILLLIIFFLNYFFKSKIMNFLKMNLFPNEIILICLNEIKKKILMQSEKNRNDNNNNINNTNNNIKINLTDHNDYNKLDTLNGQKISYKLYNSFIKKNREDKKTINLKENSNSCSYLEKKIEKKNSEIKKNLKNIIYKYINYFNEYHLFTKDYCNNNTNNNNNINRNESKNIFDENFKLEKEKEINKEREKENSHLNPHLQNSHSNLNHISYSCSNLDKDKNKNKNKIKEREKENNYNNNIHFFNEENIESYLNLTNSEEKMDILDTTINSIPVKNFLYTVLLDKINDFCEREIFLSFSEFKIFFYCEIENEIQLKYVIIDTIEKRNDIKAIKIFNILQIFLLIVSSFFILNIFSYITFHDNYIENCFIFIFSFFYILILISECLYFIRHIDKEKYYYSNVLTQSERNFLDQEFSNESCYGYNHNKELF